MLGYYPYLGGNYIGEMGIATVPLIGYPYSKDNVTSVNNKLILEIKEENLIIDIDSE